jgi:enoyl-CoA hydratase
MSEAEVLFETRGRAGVITLNRPGALNALTLCMVRAMKPQLAAWADDAGVARVIVEAAGGKAFCAGGDVRALYDWGRAGDRAFLDFYAEEYRLDTAIKRYPKPYVALLDGITMGGGVGISVHGSHRIATENLTFAMPETGIGLFPDVGGTFFLPRCPGELGMYLGLTGHRLKAADALYAGIATHFVPSEKLGRLAAALETASDVDAAVAGVAADPGRPPLAGHRDAIDRHFAGDSVEAILASLDGAGDDWGAGTAAIIRTKSPTSLKITFRQIREGAKLDFEDCMRLEYRMVNGIFKGHDFFEGTRAVVIDKDQTPHWQPARLDAVSPAMVDTYFAPLEPELDPTA